MTKPAVSRHKKLLRGHSTKAIELNTQKSKLVSETLIGCILAGDRDAFREVLTSFIKSTSKLQLSRKAGIGRQTLYDLIDPNKTFNPTLTTISAIFRGLHQQ